MLGGGKGGESPTSGLACSLIVLPVFEGHFCYNGSDNIKWGKTVRWNSIEKSSPVNYLNETCLGLLNQQQYFRALGVQKLDPRKKEEKILCKGFL